MPFDTFESVDRWVAEHGRPALEENVAGRRFAGERLRWAERWLERERERERVVEQQGTREQAADVNAQQIGVAVRAADAAESQADTAKRALEIGGWALLVSLGALIMAAIALIVPR